jgi:rare lipoprotein A (peptidoglycan hydrolase)
MDNAESETRQMRRERAIRPPRALKLKGAEFMRILAIMLLAALPALAAEKQEDKASVYSDRFEGKPTSSGEPFKQDESTAASKTLPLGTKAEVTNKETGKSTEVEINDRGPHKAGRIIDLSKSAAEEIGITKEQGVAPVTVVPK